VFVAGFIGTPPMTLFHARLETAEAGGQLLVGGQSIGLAAEFLQSRAALQGALGEEVIVGVRSEDVYPQEQAGRQPLAVTVTMFEALGSSIQVGFRFDGTPVDEARLGSGVASDDEHGLARLSNAGGINGVASFPPRSSVRIGEQITVWVDTDRLHFFDVGTGLALR